METLSCISKQKIANGEEIKRKDVREDVFSLLLLDYPELCMEDHVSIKELNHYRRLYLTSLITFKKKGTCSHRYRCDECDIRRQAIGI